MRPRQATTIFVLVVLTALGRFAAYAGMPLGQGLSVAAFLHVVALHILTFAFAVFLVTTFSRATLTRATFVALYAQAVLFLAAFVDVGLGLSIADYGQTYVGVFGGTPGSVVAVLAYGAIVAWGVHDAALGLRTSRAILAILAGIGGAIGVSFATVPWPRVALLDVPLWSVHLALATYFSILGGVFLLLAIRAGNRRAFAAIWRLAHPVPTIGFAILPLIGVVTADRLLLPPVPGEPLQRALVEWPYVFASMTSAAFLWIQWRLVRTPRAGPLALEAAGMAKVAALAFALPLGFAPFLASAVAGSAAWLGRLRRGGFVIGIVAAFAVLVGNLTVVAVDFAEVAVGGATLLFPLNQNASPVPEGIFVAVASGVLVALGSRLTNRTSA